MTYLSLVGNAIFFCTYVTYEALQLQSHARLIENGFKLMVNIFECVLMTILQDPKNVSSLVIACYILNKPCNQVYPSGRKRMIDTDFDKARGGK